ncbi:unnamed protein product [Fraxinus pennsylvanica]|uniref:Uncharacterized protein n=1 Tax=Fraxinus pennsylvanica TaxID=56036 RepID=A0AAD2DMV9_9LAMI|nr:unnamed protein product [Fraxinus pennsylvanica]
MFCRGYVSRMRSVNVVKCWPFDETDEDVVKSLLPPITLKKFTWWFDVLELSRSESIRSVKNSKKKKKTVQEKGESSLTHQDYTEESDLDAEEFIGVAAKLKPLKGKVKPRAPKKRSIKELFEVAPPVDRVSSEEDEDEDEEDFRDSKEIKWGLKGKRNEKKKNSKEIFLSKLKKPKRKINKFKKKKSNKEMDLPVANKEVCSKLHLQSHVVVNELDIDLSEAVPIQKGKPKVKHLDEKKKIMARKSSKLTAENEKLEFPMRGILKNHNKVFPLLKSRNCILHESIQANPCGIQQANKHVTFSEKDDILGRQELQKFLGSDSDTVASSLLDNHAGERGNNSTVIEMSGSEDNSGGTENGHDALSVSKKQLTIECHEFDTANFVKKHSHEKLFGTSVKSCQSALLDSNLHLFERGHGEASHDPLRASPPSFFCKHPEGHSQNPNLKVIRNSSSSYNNCKRMMEHLGNPGPGIPPLCFEDYPKAYNESSAPYLYKWEKRSNTMPQFPPQSAIENFGGHAFQYQSFPHLSPKELLSTLYSLPEVNQKRMDGDFVGLPLNSHGELIKLNSSGKGEFQQRIKPSISASSSISLTLNNNVISNCLGNLSDCRSWECRTSRGNQSNQFPVNGYMKENPLVVIPSSLGIADCQCDGTKNIDLNLIKRNDHSFSTVEQNLLPEIESYYGYQEDYQKSRNHDLVLPHLVQSKMRLMGKEFLVGGNELWKDEQIIAGHHSAGTAFDNLTIYSQNEPSIGKFRENLACSSETDINHISESMLRTKISDSRFPVSHFAMQSTDVHQNDFVASKINPVPGLYTYLSPGNSSTVPNMRSIFRDPVPHGYESKTVISEFPMPRPAFQGLPHAPRSVIRFPFMHPDLEGHAQSSWYQRSSKNLSPLLFDERETLLSYGPSYSNLGSRCGPRTMLGTNCCTDPGASLTHEAFCLHNSVTSGSAFQNSIAPAPLTQRALMPCYSGVMPNSVLQKGRGSQIKFEEPVGSRMSIRGPSHGEKARKRASAVSVDSSQPMKMPKLGSQEASYFSMTKSMTCINFEGDAENIGQPFQSNFAKNKAKIMSCGEHGNDKDEYTILTGKDSFSGTAKSGPVKLTAGAKHILKACQKMDQSSSKSTHSTVPFVATTTGFRLLESEKSAPIYRRIAPILNFVSAYTESSLNSTNSQMWLVVLSNKLKSVEQCC